MLEGQQYGPVLKINEWVMSRPIDIKEAPDSIGLSHIVLSSANATVADSLVTALKGGADFAAAAAAHSAATATAQMGGVLGVVPFTSVPVEMADDLASAKVGDIVKFESGDVIQIFKVTRTDTKKKHVLVGTVSFPVEPSSATRRAVHSTASLFSVNGKGSVDNFNAAASAAAPAASAGAATAMTSPLPGTVTKILVKAGDQVKNGDTVMILEAMKMETPVAADKDGVIASVDVAVGAVVAEGDVLVTIG
jgi:biotin carboxyl carrier protein